MSEIKRLSSLFILCIILAMIAAGCSSTKNVNTTLKSKNKPLPDYVLNSSKMIQETYIMASNYPDVLSQVPCYCGCAADGHKSNLNCFIQKMGSDNAVEAWDNHGIS